MAQQRIPDLSTPTLTSDPTWTSWSRTCRPPRRQALEPLAKYKRGNRYMIGERKYDRRLGDAGPSPADPNAYMSGLFRGAHKGKEPARDGDANPAARVADMDFEGVDVNLLLPSGWFGVWTMPEVDPAIEQSIYRAYHRWMEDYCGAYPGPPDRRDHGLRPRHRERACEELKRAAKEPWAMGVFCYAPYGMPLDHPSLEPYWAGRCGERPGGRHPHLHGHAALRARRPRQLGQPVPAALRRPPVVRHAQHGVDHRRRRARPLPERASRRPRGRPRLAAVLGAPPRRAHALGRRRAADSSRTTPANT